MDSLAVSRKTRITGGEGSQPMAANRSTNWSPSVANKSTIAAQDCFSSPSMTDLNNIRCYDTIYPWHDMVENGLTTAFKTDIITNTKVKRRFRPLMCSGRNLPHDVAKLVDVMWFILRVQGGSTRGRIKRLHGIHLLETNYISATVGAQWGTSVGYVSTHLHWAARRRGGFPTLTAPSQHIPPCFNWPGARLNVCHC